MQNSVTISQTIRKMWQFFDIFKMATNHHFGFVMIMYLVVFITYKI